MIIRKLALGTLEC